LRCDRGSDVMADMAVVSFENLKSILFNRPHMVDPDRLAVMIDSLSGRTGVAFDPEQIAQAHSRIDQLPAGARPAMRGPAKSKQGSAQAPYQVTESGTAIIRVHGTLVNRGGWIGSYSGLTSMEGLRHQLRSAIADDDVRSVVLDLDSPGGQAAGAFETAALAHELAAKKRTIAVIDDTASSAAYAIASAVSKIMIGQSGVAGSIGVVLAHFDHSSRLEKAGVKPTLIHAGARKVDANPYEPLADDVKANLQAEVDRFYEMFVATVAQGRSKLTPAAIRATEAAIYIGQAAIDAGLADEIGDLEKALAELAATEPPTKQDGVLPGLDGAKTATAVQPRQPTSAELIMALPEATGREDFAASMAAAGTTVEAAKVALAGMPTMAQRAARAAEEKKRAEETAKRERAAAIEASWDETIKDTNRRMRGW